jgi:hypothetical protein
MKIAQKAYYWEVMGDKFGGECQLKKVRHKVEWDKFVNKLNYKEFLRCKIDSELFVLSEKAWKIKLHLEVQVVDVTFQNVGEELELHEHEVYTDAFYLKSCNKNQDFVWKSCGDQKVVLKSEWKVSKVYCRWDDRSW